VREQIDARAFDSERVGYGVGPLQHFLTEAFQLKHDPEKCVFGKDHAQTSVVLAR
jgi:hypothetical protein